MPRAHKWILAGYIAVACLAYGHAWANVKVQGNPRDSEARFFLSIGAGLFWPIYLSVWIFERNHDAETTTE